MTTAAPAGEPPGDAQSLMVDEVYTSLLQAITEARLGAGTPLSQNKLAAQLGVSRTPVREALLRLEREGLVRRGAEAGGFVVASLTPDEVNEACDFLRLLDTYVYMQAMRTLSDASADELMSLARTLVRSAKAQDSEQWKEADSHYHSLVVSAAGNRFVAETLQQTRRKLHRFWVDRPSSFDGRLRTCSEDHVALAKALRDRDAAVLARRIEEHVERLRSNVLSRLESARPLLPTLGGVTGVTR